MIDLGAWVTEGYRIPGGSEEDSEPQENGHGDEGEK